MDLRVLIGVFVTLFGIAVGMAGGDITSQELFNSLQKVQDTGDFNILRELASTQLSFRTDDKPANSSINAALTTDEDVTLDVKMPATLTVTLIKDTEVTMGDSTLKPARTGTADITFNRFTGKVAVDENLSTSGEVGTVNTDALTMNYSQRKQMEIGEDDILSVRLTKLDGQEIAFKDANGTISTGSTEISLTGEEAVFKYFEGEATIQQNRKSFRYGLDGKVNHATLRSGESEITIGGK